MADPRIGLFRQVVLGFDGNLYFIDLKSKLYVGRARIAPGTDSSKSKYLITKKDLDIIKYDKTGAPINARKSLLYKILDEKKLIEGDVKINVKPNQEFKIEEFYNLSDDKTLAEEKQQDYHEETQAREELAKKYDDPKFTNKKSDTENNNLGNANEYLYQTDSNAKKEQFRRINNAIKDNVADLEKVDKLKTKVLFKNRNAILKMDNKKLYKIICDPEINEQTRIKIYQAYGHLLTIDEKIKLFSRAEYADIYTKSLCPLRGRQIINLKIHGDDFLHFLNSHAFTQEQINALLIHDANNPKKPNGSDFSQKIDGVMRSETYNEYFKDLSYAKQYFKKGKYDDPCSKIFCTDKPDIIKKKEFTRASFENYIVKHAFDYEQLEELYNHKINRDRFFDKKLNRVTRQREIEEYLPVQKNTKVDALQFNEYVRSHYNKIKSNITFEKQILESRTELSRGIHLRNIN